MARLTDSEKKDIIALIEQGQPLPLPYQRRLFPATATALPQSPKEYRLEYNGKIKREELLAQTLAAPWQLPGQPSSVVICVICGKNEKSLNKRDGTVFFPPTPVNLAL